MASTTLTAYIPLREVSGQFTTSLTSTTAKMGWRPAPHVPIGTVDGKPVHISSDWWAYMRALGTAKLGGRNFATLPDVADQVTRTQVTDLITAAQDQQAAANAQAIQAVIDILIANGLTTTGTTPPVVLARQEVNMPFGVENVETGGGGD